MMTAILSGNVARRTRKVVHEVQSAIARVLKDLAAVGENAADASLKRRSVEVARREADGLLVKGGIDERRARRVLTAAGHEAGHHTENDGAGNAIELKLGRIEDGAREGVETDRIGQQRSTPRT